MLNRKKSRRFRYWRKIKEIVEILYQYNEIGEGIIMSVVKYPPYINGYGVLSNLFTEIKKASVPPKVSRDLLSTALGLKSSSYHAAIPLLKRLGFIDQANVPTEAYKNFRDDHQSGAVMAACVKEGYAELFAANEYAYKLSRDELVSKLRMITGAGEDDKVIPLVAGTFMELCKLADFDSCISPSKHTKVKAVESSPSPTIETKANIGVPANLGISYTINLNLPATTEIEVFNVIFRSLKEHILNGK